MLFWGIFHSPFDFQFFCKGPFHSWVTFHSKKARGGYIVSFSYSIVVKSVIWYQQTHFWQPIYGIIDRSTIVLHYNNEKRASPSITRVVISHFLVPCTYVSTPLQQKIKWSIHVFLVSRFCSNVVTPIVKFLEDLRIYDYMKVRKHNCINHFRIQARFQSNWKKNFFCIQKVQDKNRSRNQQVPKSPNTRRYTNKTPKKLLKNWKTFSLFFVFVYCSTKMIYCFIIRAAPNPIITLLRWHGLKNSRSRLEETQYFFTKWSKKETLLCETKISSLDFDTSKIRQSSTRVMMLLVGIQTLHLKRRDGWHTHIVGSVWLHPDRYSGTMWGVCPRNSMLSLVPERTGRKLGWWMVIMLDFTSATSALVKINIFYINGQSVGVFLSKTPKNKKKTNSILLLC